MRFEKTFPLQDGRTLRIRNAEPADAQPLLDLIVLTHSQTDYLLAYPDERRFTPEQEAEYLKGMLESDREIMLLAEIDGTLCGCLGLNAIGGRYKVRHRAEFGISVDEAFWGMGVGKALMEAVIACAKLFHYTQLELSVVADNERAVSMYHKLGFVEFGRNPKGFLSRFSGYQTLVEMRLEL